VTEDYLHGSETNGDKYVAKTDWNTFSPYETRGGSLLEVTQGA